MAFHAFGPPDDPTGVWMHGPDALAARRQAGTFPSASAIPGRDYTESLSLAREMLRVSGMSTQGRKQTPEEAYNAASLVLHTASQAGGLTLAQFNAIRREKMRRGLSPGGGGYASSSTDDDQRESPSTSPVNKELAESQEPQTGTTNPEESSLQASSPRRYEPLPLTSDTLLQTTSKSPFPANTPAVAVPQTPIFHIKSRELSGSRVFVPLASQGAPSNTPVVVKVNDLDRIAPRSDPQHPRNFPRQLLVHFPGNPSGVAVEMVGAEVNCICGKPANMRYPVGPEQWLCANCGNRRTGLTVLTTQHALWGCDTASPCRWGICDECKRIPRTRNGFPTWRSSTLSSFIIQDDIDNIHKEIEEKEIPVVLPPDPDKPMQDDAPDPDKLVPDEDLEVKPTEDQPAYDPDAHRATKRADNLSGEISLFSTADGYWRVASVDEEKYGRSIGDGKSPPFERRYKVVFPLDEDSLPVPVAEVEVGLGITKGMVLKAVLGEQGCLQRRVAVSESVTADDAVLDLFLTMVVHLTLSTQNPTPDCYCGGEVELRLTGPSKHCDLCDGPATPNWGYGFCLKCAYTVCAECNRKEPFQKEIELPRRGQTNGLGGLYLLEGTNIIARIDPNSAAEREGLRKGMLVIQVNGVEVTTDGEILDVFKEARKHPVTITLLYEDPTSVLIACPKQHEGASPAFYGMNWLDRGLSAHKSCGVTVPGDAPASPQLGAKPKGKKGKKAGPKKAGGKQAPKESADNDDPPAPKKKPATKKAGGKKAAPLEADSDGDGKPQETEASKPSSKKPKKPAAKKAATDGNGEETPADTETGTADPPKKSSKKPSGKKPAGKKPLPPTDDDDGSVGEEVKSEGKPKPKGKGKKPAPKKEGD
ncbi:hypothetical protein DIPPA_14634 [Diplonema papillatum]|nr:hypothetical protein DIPPA_14634 [Diplonema papillatum]